MTMKIHSFLRQFTDGQKVVEVRGKTVGECLDDLVGKSPGIRQHLYDKEGKLADLWDVYVNSVSCYPDDLAKAVNDGDELVIVALVQGG